MLKRAGLLIVVLTAASTILLAQKPAWQGNIDWAANDTGDVDCPELYATNHLIQSCLVYGHRSCVIDVAIEIARQNMTETDYTAFGLTLITQCHNGDARQTIQDAGPSAVAAYLRSFE